MGNQHAIPMGNHQGQPAKFPFGETGLEHSAGRHGSPAPDLEFHPFQSGNRSMSTPHCRTNGHVPSNDL